MHKQVILFCLCYMLTNSVSHAQSWGSFTRPEKDSVIYCHFDLGKKYVGFGLGGTLLTGGWHGFSYKLEPTIGYFVFDRQLFSCSILIEQAKTQFEEDYIKSNQMRGGIYYRYYLPERKVIHMFFGQIGLLGGAFWGSQYSDGIEVSVHVPQMTFSVSGGIAFAINKYNLEIGMTKDYELINQKIIKDNIAGGSLGFIKLSYSF